MTSLKDRVSVPDRVFFRELAGETVLLELDQGKYFLLDDVGSAMWQQLRRSEDLAAACRLLLAMYEVPDDRLQADLIEFVDRLQALDLVEIEA